MGSIEVQETPDFQRDLFIQGSADMLVGHLSRAVVGGSELGTEENRV